MTTAPLATLQRAAAELAVYQAAVRLGVLDRIDREPATAEEIALGCGVSTRGARLLLAALHAVGLVETDDLGRHRPATAGLAALHPVLEPWQQLAGAVRDGVPAIRMDTVDGAERLYPQIVDQLDGVVEQAAGQAATLLPPASRILDVGAGAATWSIPLASRDPQCTVTALDLPAVCAVTRRCVQQAGRASQFEIVAANAFTAELTPRHYDLIVLGNLCHLFGPTDNRRLLSRLTPALQPVGTLAIIDVLPAAIPSVALHDVSLFLHTKNGGLHTLPEYQQWIADARLTDQPAVELSAEASLWLISGRPNGANSR